MKRSSTLTLISILAALLVIAPLQSFAQPSMATTSVALTYMVGESLTVSATPSALTIPSNGSLSSPVTVTSSWNLTGGTGETTLELDAWLGSATSALAYGSNSIASSAISATETTSLAGGTVGATACTKTVGGSPAGAACPPIFVQSLTGGFNLNSTDTSSTIALAVASDGYTAGTYTGTLTIALQVY